MTKKILVIKANGESSELQSHPSLEQMQKIVGGYIEHVRILDRIENGKFIYTSMYVNESGLIDGLPRNEKATELYQRNVKTQFPTAENPFKEANEAMAKQFGNAVVINATPAKAKEAGYEEDPWIAGDVIFFEGYTCDEVDRLAV